MDDLKPNLSAYLKTFHRGQDNAITVRHLAHHFQTSEREIRLTLRQLNMEEVPVLTSIHPPNYGVYWASSEEEVNSYLANLGSRMKALLNRMAAINRIKAKEFLKGQMEMFG
jgi:transcriptional antiterminator